jgi:hypothetical protein
MVRPAVALILACILALPTNAAAGQRRPAPEPAPSAPAPPPETVVSTQAARDTRTELQRVLQQYPPSVGRVLRLDQTLLTNADYLRPYPALASFLAQHPEVAHNPTYFLPQYFDEPTTPDPKDRAYSMWEKTLEGFMIVLFFSAIFSGIIWLIKTAVDHRRWAKLTKIQSDVHTKLLDRFASNEDLLAYIQTPAGRRFLESTPVPIDSPRSLSAPLGRILWSLQIGVIMMVAGIGIEVIAGRAIDDVAQPVAAVGILAIAIGLGFALSAAVAYVMSRRLGLLETAASAPTEPRG